MPTSGPQSTALVSAGGGRHDSGSGGGTSRGVVAGPYPPPLETAEELGALGAELGLALERATAPAQQRFVADVDGATQRRVIAAIVSAAE